MKEIDLWKICYEFKSRDNVSNYPKSDQYLVVSGKSGTEVLIINDVRLSSSRIIVCVRSSENNIIDWLHNLIAFPVKEGNQWFHYGFLRKAKSVRAGVEEVLNSIYKSYHEEIIFIGHSQGGAAAILRFMFRLTNETFFKAEVVTFGCPRYSLSRAMFPFQTDYINGNDVIPQIPFFFSRNGGKKIYITPKKKGFSWKAHWDNSYNDVMNGNHDF